jgi:SAM-dependent methyltransferase
MSDREEGLAWQIEVWDGISQTYWEEIDRRFAPVVDCLITRARLRPGERVLDLGTGTGAVAARAAAVTPGGDVLATDISQGMLALARRRAGQSDAVAFRVEEGRAETIPAADGAFDVVLACLSLMYVVDRPAAAREIARVLRSGGRIVAAVWASPEVCDIVMFQQTAARFAPPPPVTGVGPGALADLGSFVDELAVCGIEARVETEVLGFEFRDLTAAWEVLAGVTAVGLPAEVQAEARMALQAAMWPDAAQPRHFRNTTQFLTGRRC